MGNLHLVTGYAGQPHVSAADQGSLFEALIRSGEFVMEAGANFAASVVSNNKIRVNDGELLMQGRHVKMTPGAYVDLTIENGAQGYLRNDLIVARYTRNSDHGIEDCSLVVLKGTQAQSNPSDPEYTTGRLNADGAQVHDFPLYRVPLSGLNVGELVALFEPQKSLFDALLRLSGGTMAGHISMAGHKVSGLGTPTANGDAVSLGFANQKYAPAGFGLGGTSKAVTSLAELNSLKSNCWYMYASANEQLQVAGLYFAYGYGRVDNYEGSRAKQTFIPVFPAYNSTLVRYLQENVWSEWEWVNPPMIAGTEYRTTERYQGSAVYKKVNSSGDILWRAEHESQWHMTAPAPYITDATVE